ncbi:MAG: helicase domain protein [Polyangiaceae bacterium]|nr:helicase domain protein [Polyangiaceae bacterium]
MIPLSPHFDLGRDETRMKDRVDADRQTATVATLLDRFFNSDSERRWELQLVADEVGMGKTFVALGAAYSILASMATGVPEADLIGCARRVLVIAPHNTALAKKWQREVREFVSRCIPAELAPEAEAWFLPRYVDRLDELAQVLRDDSFCGVIVTHMGVLAGGKLQHYDLKRRFLLGVLFRFWGVRFQRDARARLLKGAPDGWPSQPDELTRLEDDERKRLPFRSEEQVLAAVRSIAATEAGASELEELLAVCKEIAEPYTRERGERFERVEKKLVELYRNVSFAAVDGALPLVIVDEAHNWKNGPKKNANGYGNFKRFLGPLTRRALLLTATPFQLRPQEVLELLRVGSVITPSPDPSISEQRRARLDRHRDEVIAPVLENAARQSRYVARAWARVPIRAAHALEATWISPDLIRARDDLRALAHQEGVVSGELVNKSIEAALIGSDPDVRELLRESLRLYAYNHDLSQELGAFVIRHRRRAEHRLVRVGDEFSNPPSATVLRTDRHVLHASPGIDVRGVGELPHYLLMRCVSELKGGKGRTSLGSALTGCYSTLLESAEGKSLRSKLQDGSAGKVYLDLLVGMVSAEQDPEHPKLKAVVDSVLETWRSGEKALLFCFRTHTAQRLHTILSDRIKRELETKREAALGSPEALTRLRSRFTRRDGDLVVLGLDRVLWSLRWAAASERVALPDLTADDLRLSDPELDQLAELALKYGVDLRSDQVDRVFLNRATEHVLALRLRSRSHLGSQLFTRVLGAMADETWIHFAYGIDLAADESEGGEAHGDLAGLDERGERIRLARAPHGLASTATCADARIALGALAPGTERTRRAKLGGAARRSFLRSASWTARKCSRSHHRLR